MSKQYGLILPSKNKPLTKADGVIKKPSIFDEDSDSDKEVAKKPTGISKSLKRQDRVAQDKALEEDPTVYQYDELYDEMDQKRKESKLAKKDVERKPKYINMLLAAADRRKKENERRIEREVQKEREAEGEMYKDKEAFVTSAYKKKLEERKLLEEQEKREEYLESIGKVEKQGNLDGFYRHLYEQKVKCDDEDPKKAAVKTDTESKENNESVKKEGDTCKESPQKVVDKFHRRNSSSSQSSQSDHSNNKDRSDEDTKGSKKYSAKNRRYRKRKSSDSDSSQDEETKKEHLPSNLDADSDFSIDSSDSEEEGKVENKDNNKTDSTAETKPAIKEENCSELDKDKGAEKGSQEIKKEADSNEDKKPKSEKSDTNDIKKPSPKKPKIDIWKKRTVGEVYEAAVQRYFARKAMRESQQV